jgi:GNAT superfamily N-acetyltransferase
MTQRDTDSKTTGIIRPCTGANFSAICEIINDAAQAYRGIIPPDRWKTPYMSEDELQAEISDGVVFWAYAANSRLLGVMAIQEVLDVTLIRHAYVRGAERNKGIGGKLLTHLRARTEKPLLIGTWAAADWAIRFYEQHGFALITGREKDQLLRKYWSIPPRQIETSVVLGDAKWFGSASTQRARI